MAKHNSIVESIEEAQHRFKASAAEDVAFALDTMDKADQIERRSFRLGVINRALLRLAEAREQEVDSMRSRAAAGGDIAKEKARRSMAEAYDVKYPAIRDAKPNDGFVQQFDTLTQERDQIAYREDVGA